MKPETKVGIAIAAVGYLVITIGITIGLRYNILLGIPFMIFGLLVVVLGVVGAQA